MDLVIRGFISRNGRVQAEGRLPVLWLFLIVFVFCIPPARGQQAGFGLKVQLDATTKIILPERPTPLVVKLTWSGDSVLEGRLVYTVYARDAAAPSVVLRGPEIALNTGDRIFRPILPVLPYDSSTARRK